MEESQSTSGKLSRALIEDLVLERDRVRAQFAELFTDGGFTQPEFARTVFALAKAEGLSLTLSELARPWLGTVTPDDFERCYAARLDAASRNGDSTPLEKEVPLDLFEYLDASLPRVPEGQIIDITPDAARVEALLRFLKSAATDPALVLFRKNLPEMPPTKQGSPGTIIVPPVASGPAPVDTPPPPAKVSRVVGSYQILEEIGRGGMGTVHVAYHTLLRKRFAIKILRNLPSDGEERERAIKRFTREARIYHELTHPNIVRLHEIFAHEGELLIVMEYVAGPNLRKAISADRRLAPLRVLQIGIDIGEGLQAARAKDIIHRDPKPENILVAPDGHFKITDFGIARIVRETEETRVTEEKSVLGTVGYMSPEAIRGEEVDELADIYSLGAVLYHAATGIIPCYAPDPSSMMYLTLHKEPRPVSVTVDGFPPALEAIILRCLKKNKGDRFSGYPELLDALYEARKELEQEGSGSPKKKPARTLHALLSRAAVVSGLAILGTILWAIFTAEVPDPGKETTPVIDRTYALGSTGKAERPKEPSGTPQKEESSKRAEIPQPHIEPAKIPTPKEAEPAATSLKDKLLAAPPSAGAVRRMEETIRRFEAHASKLAALSFRPLSAELAAVGQADPGAKDPASTGEERAFSEITLGAGKKLVSLAEAVFRSHVGELKASAGSVSIKLRTGGQITGAFESATDTALMLKGEADRRVAVDFASIAPEEFLPKAPLPAGEVAYRALTTSPAKSLPTLVELAETDEELLFALPIVVRLARLEVGRHSERAARDAKPLLLGAKDPESSTSCLAHATAARAALGHLEKAQGKILPLFAHLKEDFVQARREYEALELLLHRQFSKVVAAYRPTSSGPAATELVLELFEQELDRASDELLVGPGWYDWDWNLRPWDADPAVRTRYFLPGPREGPLLLQDPGGPRSLIMNNITSRVAEGLLIRLKLEPLGANPDGAHWRFHLAPEKSAASFIRVGRESLEVYRSPLTPGAADERIHSAPMPAPIADQKYRTYALVPGSEGLHVYVDRGFVLTIPHADGTIPKQLSFVVYHAKTSIKNFQVKRSPAPNGATRK